MKRVVILIAVLIGATSLQPVVANASPAIVIVDTAIDSSNIMLKDKIIHEVCIVEGGLCSNGSISAEGPGSASMPASQVYSNGFEHGTQMALVASRVNPNAKIIFIRIAGTLKNGKMASFSEVSIDRALNWVVNNKTKFNIVSVSAAVSRAYTGACPIKATHKNLIDNIVKLQSMGVATVFPAGNSPRGDYTKIHFPACIAQSVAVGGTNPTSVTDGNVISLSFNAGPDVDFYVLGFYDNILGKRVAGTSSSAAAFSAYWSKVYQGSYQETINYLQKISSSAKNQFVSSNSFINVLG